MFISKTRIRFTLLIGVILTASCTAYYQPLKRNYGYSERVLAENAYIVSFVGNPYAMSVEKARVYTLYRCAEVTLEAGYDYFETYPTVLDRFIDSPDQFGMPTVSRHIVLHKGEVPDNPRYYDARSVLEEYEPIIQRKPEKK